MRVTPDGQKMMVTSVKDVHNHDVSAEEFQLNPRVRKFDQIYTTLLPPWPHQRHLDLKERNVNHQTWPTGSKKIIPALTLNLSWMTSRWCRVFFSKTPFAFKHVQKQIHLADKVVMIDVNTARTLAGPMNVCATSCECSSFKIMDLPCSHIFAVQQTDDLPLFAAELVNEGWTQAYNNSRVPLLSEPNVSVSTVKRKKVLSYNEKFRNTSLMLQGVSSKLAA